jgi:hypothetical protein
MGNGHMHSIELIEDLRRLIEASSMQIKRQEEYVLTLQRAGHYLAAILNYDLLLIMRATLAFRRVRLQQLLGTEALLAEVANLSHSKKPPSD